MRTPPATTPPRAALAALPIAGSAPAPGPLAVPLALGADRTRHQDVPPGGFVPDEREAVRVALAIRGPIHGAEKIAAEAPYRATLAGGARTVRGSLPEGMEGVALAEIAKADGRALRVSPGQ